MAPTRGGGTTLAGHALRRSGPVLYQPDRSGRLHADQSVAALAAATNTNAIRLYESIGFRLRRRTTFMALRTPPTHGCEHRPGELW